MAANGASPLAALTQALALSATGAASLGATVADIDYAVNIEPYRAYHLDWLLPLALAASHTLMMPTQDRPPSPSLLHRLFRIQPVKSRYRQMSERQNSKSAWPLIGVGLAALAAFSNRWGADVPARLDREHRHSHTHHLSAFQRILGDSKMALAPRPLRKWSLLAPLGAVGAALLKKNGRDDLATLALTASAAGQVATLAGFRNGQRPLLKTAEGRAKGWAVGAVLALVVWSVTWLLGRNRS
jgi:hypothetical protein